MYFVEAISSAGAQRTLQVDASQGVQAQSISVFHNAKERGLNIIPILNKVASVLLDYCASHSYSSGRLIFPLHNLNK